ncbi:MAG: heme exporter protein CcmB [Acidobacteriota bacterium]
MWRDASRWAAESYALFVKEWRTEWRTRHALSTVALFAFTTLVVTSFTLGPAGTGSAMRPVLPIILWVILLFASTAGLPRSFVHEEETGTAAALRLSAGPFAVFAGKFFYNLTLLLALEVMIVPLFLVLLQVPVADPMRLMLAMLTGGWGLAAASTLIAAMVGQTQNRGPLFAVLAFPLLLPLVIFAVRLTWSAIEPSTAPLAVDPGLMALRLLLLYDGSVTVAGLMLFPVIWNP